MLLMGSGGGGGDAAASAKAVEDISSELPKMLETLRAFPGPCLLSDDLRSAVGQPHAGMSPTKQFEHMLNMRAGHNVSTCAVVGSSARLLGAGHGAEIDACDIVARVNFAPDGEMKPALARDVGKRTDVRYVRDIRRACSGFLYSLPREETGAFWCADDPDHTSLSIVELWDGKSARWYLGDADRYDAGQNKHVTGSRVNTRERFRTRVCWIDPNIGTFDGADSVHHHSPSAGMQMVAVMMRVCPRVHLFGFGQANASAPFHYWNSRHMRAEEGGVPRGGHEWEQELAFFESNLGNFEFHA